MSWAEKTIGDLVELQRGHDLPDSARKPGTVPVIGSAGLTGYHNVAKSKGPGVTLGRSGASIGKVTYVPQDFWPHNACLYVKNFKGNDPRFVAYLLRTVPLAQLNSGAAQPSLNRNFVYGVKIKFPKPTDQMKVVDVLDKYDDLIENNKRRIELLKDSARQLYKEWFVRLRFPGHEHVKIIDGVPEGWQKKPFSSVADFLNGFAFKPSHFEEDGLPIVKIPELKDGVSEKTPRNSGVDVPTSLHLEDGDLLFSWSGTLAVNVWASGPALLNQHLFKVKSTAELSRSFLLVALREAMPQFMNETTGATMKHIRRAALDKVQVIFPREHLLSEFEDFVTNCYEQVIYLYKQNISLTQARDILLPKLMSGEIAV